MSVEESLVGACSQVQHVQALETLKRITPSDRDTLSYKNIFKFNALHAVAGSNRIKKSSYGSLRAVMIVDALVDKIESLCSLEEQERILTARSSQLFTPLHSAVNQGNYSVAIVLFEETRLCFKKLGATQIQEWNSVNAQHEQDEAVSEQCGPRSTNSEVTDAHELMQDY